ncbi:uncharacterized protein LOC131650101 [Vicia villosa]|uniref:uncharacterized protein LOC131650093 n=1 Tax=Vicia villosa TaxID=3911 RepID=UPI00273B2093|nr:uncharacterized protein LOC131650093 [Vicia villosa]XP_058775817.1 uncharacterized protein LOC131650097 [Vicia villosa]XP_058775820.1 uncharacterized protein LOC131650101 [Vicia villosa]
MKVMYDAMTGHEHMVDWRTIFHRNLARPRANFVTWMLCHEKLATKDRLRRFKLITDSICSICKEDDESIAHLFFECRDNKDVWCQVLKWIDYAHRPLPWKEELKWITKEATKKGWKTSLLKLAFSETVYGLWYRRNNIVFAKGTHTNIVHSIIDSIVYRSWLSKKLRDHVAQLMM